MLKGSEIVSTFIMIWKPAFVISYIKFRKFEFLDPLKYLCAFNMLVFNHFSVLWLFLRCIILN